MPLLKTEPGQKTAGRANFSLGSADQQVYNSPAGTAGHGRAADVLHAERGHVPRNQPADLARNLRRAGVEIATGDGRFAVRPDHGLDVFEHGQVSRRQRKQTGEFRRISCLYDGVLMGNVQAGSREHRAGDKE